MKTTSYALFITASLFLGLATAKEQSMSMNDLQVKIIETSPSGSITVEVTNASKYPIKIWQESNSWGAARWRVLLIREGRLKTFFQNPNQRFTRNIPTISEIAAGAHIKHMLDLNGGNWCGLGHCSKHDEHGLKGHEVSFEPNDMIVVTYDVPRTIEAVKEDVWYGVAAAIMTFSEK